MRIRWAIAACAAAVAQAAGAITLPADGSVAVLPGTTVALQPSLAGTVIEDVHTPFSYEIEANGSGSSFLTYTLTGTVQSRVVRAIDGSFDFYWRITPDPLPRYKGFDSDGDATWGVDESPYLAPLGISSFTLADFRTPVYRADWRIDDAGDLPPSQAAGGWGKAVFGFGDDFVNPVTGEWAYSPEMSMFPDELSASFFLDTDARAYAASASFALHSFAVGLFAGDSGAYPTFGPAAAPVPEPATWALMLCGLGAVAGVARRSRAG